MSRLTRRCFLAQAAGTLAVAPLVSRRALARQTAPRQAPGSFDYIVIGGGAAGCVVASRLSESPEVRVLLVEAGGPASDPVLAQPGKWVSLLGGPWDWNYATQPEQALERRRLAWPRGRGLGGSSLINAMAYVRGHRLDYDHWRALGNAGWDFDSVLPYFLRSERNERGASAFHGSGGPLWVADTRDPSEAHLAFLEAAAELGFASRADWDFNGAQQEGGAGFYQKTIRNGARHNAADAFLSPARTRSNLVVRTSVRVTRILIEKGRAVGVELVDNGRTTEVRAGREVVLSAGVIESPKLLMLSGIGPADRVRGLGLTVVADLPGVGQNLQDHLRVTIGFRARREIAASSVSGGLFVRSGTGGTTLAPDLQFYFGRGLDTPSQMLTMSVALGRPESRGALSIVSSDPTVPPAIEARYLENPADLAALLEGVRLAQALVGTRAFAPWRGDEVAPGRDVTTPDGLAAFVRKTADTIYHPAGTCRLGRDRLAVVDHLLRVHGIDGLRVADASIMPTVVNSQTQPACMMIGERVAAMLSNTVPSAQVSPASSDRSG